MIENKIRSFFKNNSVVLNNLLETKIIEAILVKHKLIHSDLSSVHGSTVNNPGYYEISIRIDLKSVCLEGFDDCIFNCVDAHSFGEKKVPFVYFMKKYREWHNT